MVLQFKLGDNLRRLTRRRDGKSDSHVEDIGGWITLADAMRSRPFWITCI
jgi:hypothetical protein